LLVRKRGRRGRESLRMVMDEDESSVKGGLGARAMCFVCCAMVEVWYDDEGNDGLSERRFSQSGPAMVGYERRMQLF
jgi:hypothetical protein